MTYEIFLRIVLGALLIQIVGLWYRIFNLPEPIETVVKTHLKDMLVILPVYLFIWTLIELMRIV